MTLQELGAALRQARQNAGLEINDVSAKLRMSKDLVAKIEDGNRDALPAYVYACGAIKAYAQMLHIPAEDIRGALQELNPTPPEASLPVPPQEAEIPSGFKIEWNKKTVGICAAVLGCLVVLATLIAYSGEIYEKVSSAFSSQNEPVVESALNQDKPAMPAPAAENADTEKAITPHAGEQIFHHDPEAPAEKAEKSGAENLPSESDVAKSVIPDRPVQKPVVTDKKENEPAVATAEEPVMPEKPVVAPAIPEKPAVAPVIPEKSTVASAAVEKKPTTSVVEKKPTPASSSKAAVKKSGKKHVINITCIEPTWLSFRPSNGKKENVELRPGDKYKYEFYGRVRIRLGNAGGVFFTLDGVPQKSFGRSGVAVNIRLPK